MTTIRRSLLALVLTALAVVTFGASPASAQAHFGGDDNEAVAINTEDGVSVFRVAFSVRWVADGVVDQTNTAAALASCVDCQTVALAFQVVFVQGSANTVTPENVALAYNDQCVECVTYASATQIVLGVDGPVRLTGNGWRRLAGFHRSIRDLEDDSATMTVAELNAAVQAAKQELISILAEEVVPIGRPQSTSTTTTSSTTSTTEPDGDGSSTTTTTVEETTSTTTEETTSTTTEPESTSTTTTTAPETTTTTVAE
ncbi:MAG TPA: hypothetical protein VEA78_10255 [Acidimicrobiales bacterium]|nr:hypothetical protein [Acidimicrobiales bacterium]